MKNPVARKQRVPERTELDVASERGGTLPSMRGEGPGKVPEAQLAGGLAVDLGPKVPLGHFAALLQQQPRAPQALQSPFEANSCAP